MTQVSFAECRGRGLRVHQPAADHDELRVEHHRERGDVQPHRARLEVEQLERERVALLGEPAQRQRAFLRGPSGERASSWSGCPSRRSASRYGSPDSVVYTSTHPHVRPQPHGYGFASSRCSGAGTCAASMPASVSPSSGRPVRSTYAQPRPEPGASISTVAVPAPADALRLGDAAHVAVVADDERHGAAGALGERGAVLFEHVEAGEAVGQVRRFVEHAVPLLRPRDGHADALHLVPRQTVVAQVLADALDPAANDGRGPLRGVRGSLQQPGRDRASGAPDAADLRGGRSTVRADVHVLRCRHRRKDPNPDRRAAGGARAAAWQEAGRARTDGGVGRTGREDPDPPGRAPID